MPTFPKKKVLRRKTMFKVPPKKPEKMISVAKYEIKKALNRTLEVKEQSNVNNVILSGYNNTGLTTAGIIPISPYTGFVQIDSGGLQGQRIGNSIRTKRCILSVAMFSRPYSITTPAPQPQELLFYILSSKINNTVRPTTLTGLFQNGSSSSDFTSSLQDATYNKSAINKDLFHIHAIIKKKQGYASWDDPTGYSALYSGYNNNDYKLNNVWQLDVTKYIPKEILYNDNSVNPSTRLTYFYCEAVQANGTQSSSVVDSAQMYTRVDYSYTDA